MRVSVGHSLDSVAAAKRGGNISNGIQDLCTDHGPSQGQKLTLTGLFVRSLLDSGHTRISVGRRYESALETHEKERRRERKRETEREGYSGREGERESTPDRLSSPPPPTSLSHSHTPGRLRGSLSVSLSHSLFLSVSSLSLSLPPSSPLSYLALRAAHGMKE